ncbi:unnamed protein product [Adineta steineri]|uniref:Uncharacterized protein n=1 Tax=Adineta steineri TaxID=433720 RepID=A0A814WWA0_9BILA|nr:unnamed protein product [Adineta steineri]CAF3568682.1 unnamed protein product [Adineta steineri]
MDENQPFKYIEKIVLEILNRPRFWFHQWRVRRIEKFYIEKFNAKEAAYAFLKQYDGKAFVKAQKFTVRYNNQELRLCVRDIVYGKIAENSKRISNSMVEFVYRRILFSEIKWPAVTINRMCRVRWANDNNEIVNLPDNHNLSFNEDNERIVPCILCNNSNDDQSLSIDSAYMNDMNLLCENCRARLSVSNLEKLSNDYN